MDHCPHRFLSNNLALLKAVHHTAEAYSGIKYHLLDVKILTRQYFNVAHLQPLPHIIAFQKTGEPTHLVCGLYKFARKCIVAGSETLGGINTLPDTPG